MVYLYLDTADTSLKISNNFFNLSPDLIVAVSILSENHSMQYLRDNLKIISLFDSIPK